MNRAKFSSGLKENTKLVHIKESVMISLVVESIFK